MPPTRLPSTMATLAPWAAARREAATPPEPALPERGWLIFRLLYTDGCEVPEVADALQVTAQVVYNWRFRIRKEAEAFLAAEVSP